MTEIWIWNSMARRRRSASDTFEENGIQIIKKYLSGLGHKVKVIDWATSEGFNSLSPDFLKKINHFIFLSVIKSQIKFFRKFLGIVSFLTQSLLSWVQANRMKRKLKLLAKEVKKNNIRFFGIKLWYGESFTWAKYLAKQIYWHSPETIVIAGGYHAALYQEDILRYSNFDLAVTDEGEYVLHELLTLGADIKSLWKKSDYLDSLLAKLKENPIQGLIYRDNNIIKKIQRSSYTKEIEKKKAIPQYDTASNKVKVHILMESMGCSWNKCNFCVHNQFTPVYRTRGIDEIIEEIKIVINQDIGLFRFAGSDTPPQFGKSIAVAILTRGLHIEFTMGSRAVPNSKDPEIYREIVDCFAVMLRAGLRGVFIGGETGNDRINEAIMNKGLNSEDIVYTIKAIREAEQISGIKLTISLAFIYPSPLIDGISDEDILHDNIALIKASRPDSVMISPPGPFKNSTWHNECEKFGFEMSENIIPEFMEYEYVLYKPLNMWPNLNIKLQGKTFKEILAESQKFRQTVEKELRIPTDLADEHFLMIRCAGLLSPKGILEFKQGSLYSIVSGDYTYLDNIAVKVNNYSRALALCNF